MPPARWLKNPARDKLHVTFWARLSILITRYCGRSAKTAREWIASAPAQGASSMKEDSNAVVLRDVVKTYRRGKEKIEVLHRLGLSVMAGEFLALMGPSGSGKTTVLNLIGGLDRPDSRGVVVARDNITRVSGRQLANWRARPIGF